ncbi:hypothetical protein ACP8HI_01660 [Paenibacillus sp. FA6]|uniref:hypothetical protein n=1 Tax=Paenibacillus sp. FA6 TaxID=3413029 RepID=UPI003F65D649
MQENSNNQSSGILDEHDLEQMFLTDIGKSLIAFRIYINMMGISQRLFCVNASQKFKGYSKLALAYKRQSVEVANKAQSLYNLSEDVNSDLIYMEEIDQEILSKLLSSEHSLSQQELQDKWIYVELIICNYFRKG